MKKTVRALFIIIALICTLSLTSCFGFFGESKGLAFELNEDGKSYSVVGIGGCTDQYISIPNEFNGLPVTAIGEYAFTSKNIVGIKFSSNIQAIGDYAFADCANLKTIEFAKGGNLKTIGDYAFYWPSFWLWDIKIPEGVERIGAHAFDLAWPITLSLPNSLIDVGEGAFVGMQGAKGSYEAYYFDFLNPYHTYDNAIYLGNDSNPYLLLCAINNKYSPRCQINDKTKIIATNAFSNAINLQKITIPASVKQIGYRAFYSCSLLEEINVDSKNTVYQSIDGNLYGNNGTYLIQYAIGKKDTILVIPDSVYIIESLAFAEADSIKSVFIPDSVLIVGNRLFYMCSSNLSIYCEASSKPSGWYDSWNIYNSDGNLLNVIWGYTGE